MACAGEEIAGDIEIQHGERITPPGQMDVTEPMAAAIEMTCRDAFVCGYVGQLALGKYSGIEWIHRLERYEVNGKFVIKDSCESATCSTLVGHGNDRGGDWVRHAMGYGTESPVMTGEQAVAAPVPVVRAIHPVRSMAFSALRFASVLIGAGLLLRTASAEYVVSAPHGAAPQPANRGFATRQPARLILPKPGFGQPSISPERVIEGGLAAPAGAAPAGRERRRQRHEHAHKVALAGLPAPVAEASAGQAPTASTPVAEVKLGKAAGAVAAVKPADLPAADAPPVAVTTMAPPAPPRPQLAAAGLLAPVRIVSGKPSPVPTPAPSVPVATPPAAQPVQISLAPPVMRSGPRTTVLTTDVRTAMRRPASVWDYAEALPAELGARSAAVARPAGTPPVQNVATPSAIAAPERKVAQAPAVRAAVAVADRAKPMRSPEAPAGAARKTAAVPGVSPVAAAPEVSPSAASKAPRVLALLDRPSLSAKSARNQPGYSDKAAELLASYSRRVPTKLQGRATSSRQSADKRRYRVRSAGAANAQQGSDDRITAQSAVAVPLGVSTDPRSCPGEAVLADASESEISLRDRIPYPAF